MSLTWDEWSYPEGVILPIVTLGTIRPEDSGASAKCHRFSALNCTGKTQVSGRLAISGGISPRHAQNPLSGGRKKKLSITTMPYHPRPHIIICTSFISSIDYNVFIVLQCHSKDLLCRIYLLLQQILPDS